MWVLVACEAVEFIVVKEAVESDDRPDMTDRSDLDMDLMFSNDDLRGALIAG